ncbi:MAG: thiamine biosynthesis lipoprotein [Gammaproteobacteria bacterium]
MKHLLVIFLLGSIAFLPTRQAGAKAQETYNRTLKLMGSRFDITVIANSKVQANTYIDLAVGEIQRIERLISSWDPNSQTSAINQNAGIKAVVVDPELLQLIQRSIGLSKLTDGAFDISYASMDRIWQFDGSMTQMPAPDIISASVAKVGYGKIDINVTQRSVYLKEAGMKIGFGAIGKGYAADKAKALLIAEGVEGGIINASGDMNTWGTQSNGEDWMIAITNPMDKSKSYGLLPIKKGAVVTSGNYEKFVSFDGKRYAHIIDPRTGYPAKGIISVTVFAPKAELADALATSIFVMGIDAGINRINQMAEIECIIIDDIGGIHHSNQIKIKPQ